MKNLSSRKNKFKFVYLLTLRGITEKVKLTWRFLSRNMQQYEALIVETKATQ
jgi:hypothetical protein